jgi:hypothetical protein
MGSFGKGMDGSDGNLDQIQLLVYSKKMMVSHK